jgi:adenylate cyclase
MAELAAAIMNEPPNPLSGRVPTGIQLVIARCLDKEPARRYRSASEVAAALEALDPSGIRRGAAGGSGAWRTWALGLGVLVIGAIAVWLAVHTADIQKRLGPGGGTATDAGAPGHIGSLAVLPLANLSGDPSQEFFADGMTDELITNLAPIHSLKVISRTSVMPFKNSNKSLKEIAAALDVDAIVEGSVLRAGDKVRITAQLIQAAQDRHLWAKSYEREVKDVIALQSEVARDIAKEIQLQLSPEEHALMMKPRRPVNTEAYELYLRGRYEWSKVSPEGSAQAITYYKKAMALDPKDARYPSGLADAYLLQVQVLNMLPEKQGMDQVKEYARRALALDDSSAEAHTSMAIATLFGDWNWKEAEHHARDAIQLNPGYSTGHLVRALILVTQGRFNEAIQENDLALRLDPLSLIVNWHAAAIRFYARRYDEAIAAAKHTMELYPTSPLPHGALAMSYEQTGRFEEMMDVMEKAMPPGVHEEERALFPRLRAAYAKGGPAGYWRETLAIQLEGQRRMRVYSRDYARLAMLYLKTGQKDEAIREIQRGLADHSGDLIFINVMPCFDELHADPRFKAIMKRVGAPNA